ncbi:MAG: RecQ family ATP-dependent DNA helicase [Bacteroidota bacterium]
MNHYKQILVKYWGYSDFRPLQEDIINSVLEGKDTLALMPTGGGKSLTFQIPALANEGICLVITPLIALMRDQVENLNKRGINALAIHSGMSKNEIDITLDNCIFGDYKFLYLSPERVDTELFQARVAKMNVNLVAIDEAHCISQWGYDFRPSYLNIAKLREFLTVPAPFLALTATATPRVIDDIQEKLQFKQKNVLWKSFERKNLIYLVRNVENKNGYLVKTLQKVKGTGIIYTRSRKRTWELAEMLQKQGMSADFYHAGLDSEVRNKKQDAWQNGRVRIITATNAFGMGIDKPDVRFVIHYDLPDSLEAYYQEAGRAGRDGERSFAVLLFNENDRAKVEQRKKTNFPEIKEIKTIYEALGNFLRVPLESGKYQAYDFNIFNFVSEYKFNMLNVYSALKFLQKDGYIELTDELSNKSKVHFKVNRDDLYNFQLSNEQYDRFIKLLLRSYTGLFTNYTKIDETELAKKAGVKIDLIYKYLNRLKYFKIIDYIPYRKNPMIVFTEERRDKKNLYISPENYKELKDRYIEKIDAVLDYATKNTKCRSVQLLEYFGETNVYRCGKCDVCNKRNELELSRYEFDEILEVLKNHLQVKTLSLEELVDLLEKPEQKVLKVVDWLIDNGKLKRDPSGKFRWHKF